MPINESPQQPEAYLTLVEELATVSRMADIIEVLQADTTGGAPLYAAALVIECRKQREALLVEMLEALTQLIIARTGQFSSRCRALLKPLRNLAAERVEGQPLSDDLGKRLIDHVRTCLRASVPVQLQPALDEFLDGYDLTTSYISTLESI